MSKRVWIYLTVGMLVLAFASIVSASRADAHGLGTHPSGKGWCVALPVAVSPAPGLPRSWEVAARYCRPWGGTRTVDVLTAGSTYTAAYWDWSREYSYVGKTLAAGRATLAYDRIGNGGSTRPASTEITMTSDAWVLHQLMAKLHWLGARRINSVSHSYGVGVALREATTDYGDGVHAATQVFTGYLHRPSNPLVTAGNYPAYLDPKFDDLDLDAEYLTTRPGARAYGFHSATTDPAVIMRDERDKDIVSRTGLLGFLADRGVPPGDNLTALLDVPVLVVTGGQDAIFCLDPATFDCADEARVTANETPFYPRAPLTVRTVPLAGHDLTLHPADSFAIIDGWLS